MEEKLRSFLKAGSDWARLKTSFPGVFVLKLPPFRGSPARLAVELNPVEECWNMLKDEMLANKIYPTFREMRGGHCPEDQDEEIRAGYH